MKRFIILLIVVGLYYPSYAQEYKIEEIEEQTIQELRREVE